MQDAISLGIGGPDFVTPGAILEAGIHLVRHGEPHCTSNAGIFELRQILGEQLARRCGVSYRLEDEILVTVGASGALSLALTAAVEPEDEVVVHTPCFVSYQPEVVLAGGMPIPLETRMEEDFKWSTY